MLLQEVVATSEQISATSKRLAKIESLAALLGNLEPAEIEVGVGFLIGVIRQGTIGVGYASLRRLAPPAAEPAITVHQTDEILTAISA